MKYNHTQSPPIQTLLMILAAFVLLLLPANILAKAPFRIQHQQNTQADNQPTWDYRFQRDRAAREVREAEDNVRRSWQQPYYQNYPYSSPLSPSQRQLQNRLEAERALDDAKHRLHWQEQLYQSQQFQQELKHRNQRWQRK